MSFKEQLTKLRKRYNITQIDLANKLNVKQYVISSWETGRSEPNINQLMQLADIFEVPTDYLLDKTLVRAGSDKEFDNALKMFEQDNNDEFLNTVGQLCSSLSQEKKKKMLEIIKASLDFNK